MALEIKKFESGDELKDAIRELFEERGDELTMDDIAQLCGFYDIFDLHRYSGYFHEIVKDALMEYRKKLTLWYRQNPNNSSYKYEMDNFMLVQEKAKIFMQNLLSGGKIVNIRVNLEEESN